MKTVKIEKAMLDFRKMRNCERRTLMVDSFPRLELRGAASGGKKLFGYAALFDTLSLDLGGFREKIAPGAFAKTIRGDVRCLMNHDSTFVLGRTTNRTLTLNEDSVGLAFEVILSDTQFSKDLANMVSRGDITGCSFGFSVIKDDWKKVGGENIRTLLDVKLYEISVCTFPAYSDTIVSSRGKETSDAMARRYLRCAVLEKETGVSRQYGPRPELAKRQERLRQLRVEDVERDVRRDRKAAG